MGFPLRGNGQKKGKVNYKNSVRDGLLVVWYVNGQNEKEVNYKDGERVGYLINWHENGEKKRK
tara:strand:+ start:324 stop:512 length:189 start_codon:yes stop_codon:yes gene_type:complete